MKGILKKTMTVLIKIYISYFVHDISVFVMRKGNLVPLITAVIKMLAFSKSVILV